MPFEISGFKSLLLMTFAGFLTSLRRASSVLATSANGRVTEDWAEASDAQVRTSAAELMRRRFMIFLSALSRIPKGPFRNFARDQLDASRN
jgi:hypothetical protein